MIRRYLVLTKTLLLSFFRDPQTLFFTMAMPLVFLFIFGFLYGNMGEEGQTARVAVFVDAEADPGGDLMQVLAGTAGITSETVDSLDDVTSSVSSLKADMGLAWDGKTLGLYTNPARMQDNNYFEQLTRGIKASLDQRRLGLVELVRVENRYVGKESLLSLDFLFPGIIALGVMSSGLFAISAAFMHYKDKKVLKRLMATSMRKGEFLAALMTTRMVTSVISALLVLAVGFFVFRVTLTINWFLFLPYLLVSTVIMMGFGALVTMVAKTAENAVQVSSILVTIMMFFSGVYFPIEFLPTYFQKASQFLPLSYVSHGFRYAMGIEPMPYGRFLLETSLLLLVSLILTFVVTLRGRWTEK